MATVLRAARLDDAPEAGRILYEAFRVIAERHGYAPDFPSPEAGVQVMGWLLSNPGFYGVAAEQDGASSRPTSSTSATRSPAWGR